MTNREETGKVSGLSVPYSLTRSGNSSQPSLNHQGKEGSPHKHDASKHSSRKSVHSGKMTKPTLEIYRPPTKGNQKNGAKVHFQSGPSSKGSPTPLSGELKSALKRSKSFAGSDLAESAPVGFDRDAFPLEYQGLLRNAMLDPNLLSSRQLMELVRIICSKAVESVQYAEPAAQTCFTIIQKEKDGMFLESLLTACREWYNERDKLLRSPFPAASGVHAAGGGSRRWTAYVSFLTELYMRLKSQHHQSVLLSQFHKAPSASGDGSSSPATNHHALTLLTLLYECALIILKPPALNNVAEVECLRSMMITVGKLLEKDAPQRMQQVIASLRDAFVNPSVTAQIRKTILELIELHASNWQLDLPQSMYYFPYTCVDRR